MRSFNPAQLEAIRHKDGPMMVLAGPGSGKTTVITERIRCLIEEAGVHPGTILVVTFTKAAAVEMKSRFLQLCGGVSMPVSFGTFHSIFFSILKAAYNYQAGDIITDSRRMEIFREIVADEQLELDDENDFITGIASEISLVKGENMNLDHYYSTTCAEDIFRRVYAAYNRKLRQARQIDFDDMLVFTWELFRERKDILKAWQNKFQYILIDEFQDINRLQYEIIRMLAAPKNNLFIVGDDDQSIYRFRGAKPEIMLGFLNDYPGAKQALLDVNYRCTQEIVEGALRVIKNNKKRYAKALAAFHKGGEPLKVKLFNDVREEYDTVIKEICGYHKDAAMPLKDMAVLYRTNTGSRQMIAKLMEYNIPFRMKDNVPNIFEHWIARDLIAYIKVAMGSQARSDFLRIINRPKRYIARQYMEGANVTLEELRQRHAGKEWAVERLDKLIYDMKTIRDMDPFAAVNYIRYAVGYDGYLTEYASMRRLAEDELLDVVTEIQESARDFKTFEQWFSYMENYGLRLQAQARRRENAERDGVVLSTMHSAKGLEYDAVFIIDANEGVVPHKKAVMEEDVEEERRMFYVAMTRARKYLHIYFAKERYHKPAVMSRFVGELLLDRDKFTVGQRVRHKVYGEGRIVQITQTSATILFEADKTMKTLSISFCISNNLLTLL